MSKLDRVKLIIKTMTKSEREQLAESVVSEFPDLDSGNDDDPPHMESIAVLLSSMTNEDRKEAFSIISDLFCIKCGSELPDDDNEPDHECVKDKGKLS